MSSKPVINIINFVRGIEPRYDHDIFEPVIQQHELMRKHNLNGTWLLQYDAMLDERYQELCRQFRDEGDEIGGWLEIVKPQCEAVGIEWKGRFPWDWHAHCGFSVGYTPEEREKLADEFVTMFEKLFNQKPASVGSWMIDAHTYEYLSKHHGLRTSCICKEQFGTDGYTMWGGYWNNGYYPSKKNAFLPAQNRDMQIDVPVFRMLGSDPLYQYSDPLGTNGQTVLTLECICPCGQDSEWIDWYLKQLQDFPALTFGYAQTGQENSFGWEQMEKGLTYQFEKLEQMRDNGEVKIETLGQTGEDFRKNYDVTPVCASGAMADWQKKDNWSVWFDSRFYRANLARIDGRTYLRDIHMFNENYEEHYLNSACSGDAFHYDTLPVIDGSGVGQAVAFSAAVFCDSMGQELELNIPDIEETDSCQLLEINWGMLKLSFTEKGCTVKGGGDWSLVLKGSPDTDSKYTVSGNKVEACHEDFAYSFSASSGSISRRGHDLILKPVGEKLVLEFC